MKLSTTTNSADLPQRAGDRRPVTSWFWAVAPPTLQSRPPAPRSSRSRSTSATVASLSGASVGRDHDQRLACRRARPPGRRPPPRPADRCSVVGEAPQRRLVDRSRAEVDEHLDRARARPGRRAPAPRARSRRGSRSPPGTARSRPCPPSATSAGEAISSISAVAPIANGSGRFISVAVQRSQKPGPVLGARGLRPQPADDLARLGARGARAARSAPAAASRRRARRSPTTTIAPIAIERTTLASIRNSPASATITVTPENATAIPDVRIATARASSARAAGSQLLAVAGEDEQRVVHRHADAEHRGHVGDEDRHPIDLREQEDDRAGDDHRRRRRAPAAARRRPASRRRPAG